MVVLPLATWLRHAPPLALALAVFVGVTLVVYETMAGIAWGLAAGLALTPRWAAVRKTHTWLVAALPASLQTTAFAGTLLVMSAWLRNFAEASGFAIAAQELASRIWPPQPRTLASDAAGLVVVLAAASVWPLEGHGDVWYGAALAAGLVLVSRGLSHLPPPEPRRDRMIWLCSFDPRPPD